MRSDPDLAAVFDGANFRLLGATASVVALLWTGGEFLCDPVRDSFGAETAAALSPGGLEQLLVVSLWLQALTLFVM